MQLVNDQLNKIVFLLKMNRCWNQKSRYQYIFQGAVVHWSIKFLFHVHFVYIYFNDFTI
jgi:hypothetical protein